MAQSTSPDGGDQIPGRLPWATFRQSRLGITVGFVVGGGLGLAANVAQVVDLFNHGLATIVLVAAVVAILGGIVFLAWLWRAEPNGWTLAAIALTVVGSVALGWVIGHTGSTTAVTTGPPTTFSTPPPSSTGTTNPLPPGPSVQFAILRNGGTVHQKEQLLVTVNGGLPDGAVPRVFAREDGDRSVWAQEPCKRAQGTDSTLFTCDGIYGDADRSRGHLFWLFAAILNSTDSRQIDELRGRNSGNGAGFPVDNRPFQAPVAESPTIYVHREG